MSRQHDELGPQSGSADQPRQRGFLEAPADTGRPGRRYVIQGGTVMSMDPAVGDFEVADILVEEDPRGGPGY